MTRFALLDVPPARPLVHRLAECLDARLVFDSVPTMWSSSHRAPEAAIDAPATLASWLGQFADSVETVLDADELPVVIGRASTLLLGTLLALKRRGRHGLLVVGPCRGTGEDGSDPPRPALLDLVLAHGRASTGLADIEGRGPLVFPEDVVAFGVDGEPFAPGVHAVSVESVQAVGIEAASGRAVDRVARPELDGFCVHIDAAVLPPTGVASNGFAVGDVATVLRTALDSGRTAGLQVTTGDLGGDVSSTGASRIADLLVEGLRGPPHAAAP